MDHDAMHKDVSKLKTFMKDAEEAVAFYKGMKAAGGVPAPGSTGVMTSEAVDQIVAKVVEQLLPKVQDLTGRVEALEQKPAPAMPDMASFDERLNKLETGSAGSAPAATDPELAGRLEAMLTWFEANQEGLELLLELDGEPDADTGANTGGTADTGTAAGGATGATGASGDGTGTDGAAGSVNNLPGTSQDASADAAKVVDQPTATSGT